MADRNRNVLSFGPFELSIGNRLLTNGTKVVTLGARAMDLLVVLVEQANQVVSQRALIERVWPTQGADQVSLRVHISALRKALAEGDPSRRYIATVPGRGYSFIVPVISPASQRSEPGPSSRSVLPARLMRMVGRKDIIAEIQTRLTAHKFMTIVGPGGIGKTTVATAITHEMRSIFEDRIRFIDLSSLGDASLIASAAASSFGLTIRTNDVVPALVDRLQEAPTLLVLDGCEHLIDGASALAEKLFFCVPTLHLLATSREALRVEGENVHELAALECPPDDQRISARRSLEYPAVQLLVDRVRAVQGQFELVDADAPIAAAICRRLDGIALAIELAAGRTAIYGLGKTASLLDEHLNLSWVGRRTAAARHQTLNAALEWSYDLLDERESLVLSRLGVFSGAFTFETAIAVVADEKVDEATVSDCVWELRSKSLITAGEHESRLRLLDTTRAFALQRLAKSDENLFRRRHALYFSDLFRQGTANDVSSWPKALGIEIGNLRAALNWAFSAAGDAKIGIELAAASASTWMGMALLTEGQEWMSTAMSRLDDVNSGTRQEMIIQSAFAGCTMFTGGMTEESYAMWAKALVLAERLNDIEHQLDALLVMWAHELRVLNYAEAIKLADHCGQVAEGTGRRGAIATANYMRGITYYHVGRIVEAQGLLEASLLRDDEASRQLLIRRFGYDRKIDNMAGVANLAWLRGSPDQARRLNQMTVAEARQSNQAVNLCGALTFAGFVAYLTNPDDGEAKAHLDELAGHAAKYTLHNYQGFCLCMQALYIIRRGEEIGAASATFYSGIEKMSAARYGIFNSILQAEFARCLAFANWPREGLDVFERAKIDLEESRWYGPELHRIRGELALRNDEGVAVARQYFLRAIEMSDRQGSLSWALRAATSLAMAEKSDARREEARSILRAIHAKFRDGSDTSDLRLATRVMDGSYWRDHIAGTAR
jgi:predicted ATPase/DNA-binding winged helix-turn-helix (wHTH) protein